MTVVTVRTGILGRCLTPAVAILSGLCTFPTPKQAKVKVKTKARQVRVMQMAFWEESEHCSLPSGYCQGSYVLMEEVLGQGEVCSH